MNNMCKNCLCLNNSCQGTQEAVWNNELNDWNTDFSYATIGVDSFDVAGSLDFEGCRKAGYTFID